MLRLISAMTIYDHVYLQMADTVNTCCEINVHLGLKDSCENFIKMSAQVDAFDRYFLVISESQIWVQLHFRCFDFNQVVQQH